MKLKSIKFMFFWFAILFFSTITFFFLHECGHGFGATIDGTHVSTGFNKVGDVGKKPNDEDFRSNLVEDNTLTSSSFLGPAVNWSLAIIFTLALASCKTKGKKTLIIAALALTNALNRFIALIPFFIGALFHKVMLADEVGWGIGSIKSLNSSIRFADFKFIASNNPMLILSEPKVYFWPAVSIIISFVCFFVAIRQLKKLYKEEFKSKFMWIVFKYMPIIAFFIALIPIIYLDNLIRINW